jgi:diketogulonate reductase-like aldo/keto reductase
MDANPKVPLSSGDFMPLIGLGMFNFKPNDKQFNLGDFVMKAANAGYTHFDVTNNEAIIGDALKLVVEAKRQLEDEEGEKIPDQF